MCGTCTSIRTEGCLDDLLQSVKSSCRCLKSSMSSRVGSRPIGRGKATDRGGAISESEEGDDGSDLEEMEVRDEVESPPVEREKQKEAEKKEKKISKPRAPRPKLTLELLEVNP